MPSVFTNKYSIILTLVLAAQGFAFHLGSRGEYVPEMRPLSEFPAEIDGWRMGQEFPIEAEIMDVLRADDTMNRSYIGPAGGVGLFVAFFETQRTGQAPHSPKNCLPGSGWEPSETGNIQVQVPGHPVPIEINRYIVSRGSDSSLVLYWYQSRDRVIASEYSAKFWLVTDSIRYRRSDTSLVRVTVRVARNDVESASKIGVQFVQDVFPALRAHLPH